MGYKREIGGLGRVFGWSWCGMLSIVMRGSLLVILVLLGCQIDRGLTSIQSRKENAL